MFEPLEEIKRQMEIVEEEENAAKRRRIDEMYL